MRHVRGLFALLTVLAAFGVVASADDPKDPKDPKDPAKDGRDPDFVMMAASGGHFEVQSSQLALQKGGSEAVKKFARQMVDDHTKANKELMDLARRKGYQVAPAFVQKHFDVYAKLAREVQNFDAQYAKEQIAAHEEAVALFDKQAKEGKDADLKAWAEKTLPTLKTHLDQARELGKGGKEKQPEELNPPKDPKKKEPKDP